MYWTVFTTCVWANVFFILLCTGSRRSLSFEGWLEARGIGGLGNEELREVLMDRDCKSTGYSLFRRGLGDHEGVLVGEYLCYNQVIEFIK